MGAPRRWPMNSRSLCGNYILGRRPVKREAEKVASAARRAHLGVWAKLLPGGALGARDAARFSSKSFNALTAPRTSQSARVAGMPGNDGVMPTRSRLFK